MVSFGNGEKFWRGRYALKVVGSGSNSCTKGHSTFTHENIDDSSLGAIRQWQWKLFTFTFLRTLRNPREIGAHLPHSGNMIPR